MDELDEFNKRMKKARDKADLVLDEVGTRAKIALGGEIGPSREIVRKMEVGLIKEKDLLKREHIFDLLGIAEVYGVSVRDLSPLAADALEKVNRVMSDHFNKWNVTQPTNE